jgi:acyl carrier protein
VPGSDNATLKHELKQLIIAACNKEAVPGDVPDDAPLLGPHSVLELDSLDVLQINVALQQRYGVRIDDGKHARRVMTSINALADFVSPK